MANEPNKSEIAEYARGLAEACGGITTIWLLGSRANGTARDDSDWDLLVFGSEDVFECLQSNDEVHRDDVDCFVLLDDDAFERAWGERKSGSLAGWKWQQLTATQAQYTETRWSDREGSTGVISKQRRAIRIWPMNEHAT